MIGKQLKLIRETKQLSKYRVERIADITSEQIAAIESGESNYTIDKLINYLRAIDCGIEFKQQNPES